MWAWTALVTKVKTLRDCCRQVATTVRVGSMNRLPDELEVPNDNLGQMTACRKSRARAFFVRSLPSALGNVQRQWR